MSDYFAGLPKWAKPIAKRFPIRRQGEFDGACVVYCLLSIARSQNIEVDSWVLGDLLPQELWGRALGKKGIGYNCRREFATQLGLKLAKVPLANRETILAHFMEGAPRTPLMSHVIVTVTDPCTWLPASLRFPPDGGRHAVAIVEARDVGLLIADSSPWSPPFSVWSWKRFAARARPRAFGNGGWRVETVTRVNQG